MPVGREAVINRRRYRDSWRREDEGACRGPSRPGGRREGNLSGERGEGGAVAAAAAQQADEEAAESGA